MYRLIIGFGMILFMSSFSGCFEYDDVDFNGIKSFSVVDKDLDNLKIKFGLDVNNPNAYNIKIKKSTLDIYVNDKYAGKAVMTDKIILKKNSSGVYDVYLKTNASDILKAMGGSLGSILSGKVKIGVKGKLKAGAYGITRPFDVDFSENVSLNGFL